MKTFKTFKTFLLEDKTRLINKLDLTPDQKEEAIAFFKKHPQREKEIDWNRKDLTWSDLEKILHGTTTKSQLKQVRSISGMKEGKDYIELETGLEDWYAYVPLHHQASRAIASSRIGGVEGKWCIAQNDDKDWKKYIYDRALIPIYLVNYEEEDKFALMLAQNKIADIYDKVDKKNTSDGIRLRNLVYSKITSQKSKLSIIEERLGIIYWLENGVKSGVIKVKDADYIIDDSRLIWKDGTWERGIWKGGTWVNGTWEYGVWESGTWIKGLWEAGQWHSGTWKSGTWKGGSWKAGTWETGTWEAGDWRSGTWKDGIWLGGYDEYGKFHPAGDSPNRW